MDGDKLKQVLLNTQEQIRLLNEITRAQSEVIVSLQKRVESLEQG